MYSGLCAYKMSIIFQNYTYGLRLLTYETGTVSSILYVDPGEHEKGKHN